MGGQLASVLGQEDPRISTIVSWDRGTGLQLPKALHTPTLFFIADYACQANPVCQPEPYPEPPPDPRGPGERGRDYEVVRAAGGVDTMKVAMRAATHLDWVPSEPAGNRYVETVSVYYTLAWFDRYLKGSDDPNLASEAFKRLTAPVFDDSADRHNISQGFYDPGPGRGGRRPVRRQRPLPPSGDAGGEPDVLLLPLQVLPDGARGRWAAGHLRGHAQDGLPHRRPARPGRVPQQSGRCPRPAPRPGAPGPHALPPAPPPAWQGPQDASGN